MPYEHDNQVFPDPVMDPFLDPVNSDSSKDTSVDDTPSTSDEVVPEPKKSETL